MVASRSTGTVRRSAPHVAAEPPSMGTPLSEVRLQIDYVDVHSLHDYRDNPRDNSNAIASVANSIRAFSFLVPVIVDQHNVIVAGHTRVAAAKTLNLDEVPVIRASHLTTEQIQAFRVIDNKVAELSAWDFEKLAPELQALAGYGFLLTDFGWQESELTCFGAMVASDCLSTSSLEDRQPVSTQRRAPTRVRVVIGEITFFLEMQDYRSWVDGLRNLHNYDETAIVADIKGRLNITERAVEAAVRRRRAPRASGG